MQNDKSIQMNKREIMAMHILAGLVSNAVLMTKAISLQEGAGVEAILAVGAVRHTDALIAALRKRPDRKTLIEEVD